MPGPKLCLPVLVDDASLIEATLAGRRNEFGKLVERHQRKLYAFVYRMLGDVAASQDVVQGAFVIAYQQLGQFRGDASFKTWLYQIARNECRTRQRSAGRRSEIALEEAPEEALCESGDEGLRRACTVDLQRHIERLPDRQRAVLILRVYGDLAFREIAEIEGISEGAAKVSFHRAVRQLKRLMCE